MDLGRALTNNLNTTTPHCLPLGIVRPRLVLSVERLRRRDHGANGDRVASILGGAGWLVRAWKRIERSAALKRLRRVSSTHARRPGNPLRLGVVHTRRVDVFHAPSMAFRF